MEKKLANNNGITLVALIITIIVMLILAGVSISLVLGSNGVLTQANKAQDAQSEAEIRDHLVMAVGGVLAENKGKIDYELLKTAIDKDEILVKDNFDTGAKTYTSDKVVYEIDDSGSISETPRSS